MSLKDDLPDLLERKKHCDPWSTTDTTYGTPNNIPHSNTTIPDTRNADIDTKQQPLLSETPVFRAGSIVSHASSRAVSRVVSRAPSTPSLREVPRNLSEITLATDEVYAMDVVCFEGSSNYNSQSQVDTGSFPQASAVELAHKYRQLTPQNAADYTYMMGWVGAEVREDAIATHGGYMDMSRTPSPHRNTDSSREQSAAGPSGASGGPGRSGGRRSGSRSTESGETRVTGSGGGIVSSETNSTSSSGSGNSSGSRFESASASPGGSGTASISAHASSSTSRIRSHAPAFIPSIKEKFWPAFDTSSPRMPVFPANDAPALTPDQRELEASLNPRRLNRGRSQHGYVPGNEHPYARAPVYAVRGDERQTINDQPTREPTPDFDYTRPQTVATTVKTEPKSGISDWFSACLCCYDVEDGDSQ